MCADFWQITAIDVGYRNFSWCTLNPHGIISHDNVDLWQPQAKRRRQPTRSDLVAIVVQWCRLHADLLNSSDKIVLENQMRQPFIVMNVVLHALYFDKVVVVHPMTVGSYWHLPTTRDKKKAAGIRLAQQHGVQLCSGKQDDMADTWLMAQWQLNQMNGT
jgi:hypothetical protein